MHARTHARTRTCSPSLSLGPSVSCLFWVGPTRKTVLLGSSQQLPATGAEMGAENDGGGTKRRRASRDAVNAHGVRPAPISVRLRGDARRAPTRAATYLRALTEYATATATAAKPIQTNKPTQRAVHTYSRSRADQPSSPAQRWPTSAAVSPTDGPVESSYDWLGLRAYLSAASAAALRCAHQYS